MELTAGFGVAIVKSSMQMQKQNVESWVAKDRYLERMLTTAVIHGK